MGTQGKVIAYIDGSDRALVSAWLMMKRGCRVLTRGDGDLSDLRNYDGYVREFDPTRDDQKKVLGIVMGTDLDAIKDVDVSQFEIPVFFPTIGMSDDEVRELADTIRNGL